MNDNRILLLTAGAVALALVFSMINFVQIGEMRSLIEGGAPALSAGSLAAPPVHGNASEDTALFAGLPRGVPNVYGAELGVSFDDVSLSDPSRAEATIEKLAALDTSIQLEGDDLARYIEAVSPISCEYCCDAESLIFPDGEPACGCAHSFAMRGLAKYLITEHPNEFSNGDILEELGKWKALFFPQQISQKAAILESNGIPLNFVNLSSNKYQGIESGLQSDMVGEC